MNDDPEKNCAYRPPRISASRGCFTDTRSPGSGHEWRGCRRHGRQKTAIKRWPAAVFKSDRFSYRIFGKTITVEYDRLGREGFDPVLDAYDDHLVTSFSRLGWYL